MFFKEEDPFDERKRAERKTKEEELNYKNEIKEILKETRDLLKELVRKVGS